MTKTLGFASYDDLGVGGEVHIEISVHPHLRWVTYEGTAEQLAAEGLIPNDFEWPMAARQITWDADGLTYILRRARPRGWKGPMRSWIAVDHWSLLARRQKRMLPPWVCPADPAPANTPATRTRSSVPAPALTAARADGRFRAFVASIPCLARAMGYRRHTT